MLPLTLAIVAAGEYCHLLLARGPLSETSHVSLRILRALGIYASQCTSHIRAEKTSHGLLLCQSGRERDGDLYVNYFSSIAMRHN